MVLGSEKSLGKGAVGILGSIALGSTVGSIVGNKGTPPIGISNKGVPKGTIYEVSNKLPTSRTQHQSKDQLKC